MIKRNMTARSIHIDVNHNNEGKLIYVTSVLKWEGLIFLDSTLTTKYPPIQRVFIHDLNVDYKTPLKLVCGRRDLLEKNRPDYIHADFICFFVFK